jgi:hypothetical protein
MVSLYPLFKKWSKNKKRYRPNGLTFILFIINFKGLQNTNTNTNANNGFLFWFLFLLL